MSGPQLRIEDTCINWWVNTSTIQLCKRSSCCQKMHVITIFSVSLPCCNCFSSYPFSVWLGWPSNASSPSCILSRWQCPKITLLEGSDDNTSSSSASWTGSGSTGWTSSAGQCAVPVLVLCTITLMLLWGWSSCYRRRRGAGEPMGSLVVQRGGQHMVVSWCTKMSRCSHLLPYQHHNLPYKSGFKHQRGLSTRH